MINIFKKRDKFNGTWKGFYKYDKHPSFGKYFEVPFNLKLQENIFGKITGSVQDDTSKGGIEEPGIISGHIVNEAIYFTKKMPVLTMIFADGKRGKYPAHGYEIYYKGAFDDKENKFRGTWLIKGDLLLDTKDNLYKMDDTTGTWEMTKE